MGRSDMCLNGDLETMIEVLNDLSDARLQLKQWTAGVPDGALFVEERPVHLKYYEGIDLFKSRIAALETRCRELGIHGPAPKADPGDQRRIVDGK